MRYCVVQRGPLVAWERAYSRTPGFSIAPGFVERVKFDPSKAQQRYRRWGLVGGNPAVGGSLPSPCPEVSLSLDEV